MQLTQLYESSELKSYKNWKSPSVQSMKEDFADFKRKEEKWENRARIILLQTPLFTDFEDFREKVQNGEIREIDRSFAQKVRGMSAVSSVAALKSLVKTYSKPRDVDRIVNGMKNEEKLPMPIIIKGKEGMWVLSGNTRCNASFALGFKPKVIIIDLSKEESDEADV